MNAMAVYASITGETFTATFFGRDLWSDVLVTSASKAEEVANSSEIRSVNASQMIHLEVHAGRMFAIMVEQHPGHVAHHHRPKQLT